jgi:putative drug exporter of the RND superfamily
MHMLLSIASGRRAKFFVIPLFVIAALLLGSLQPQLQEASENAPAESWLPTGSESLEAQHRLSEARGQDEGAPAIVVVATRSGEPLAPEQLAAIDQYARDVDRASAQRNELSIVQSVTSPAAPGAAQRGQLSQDGSTATVVVDLGSTAQPAMQPVIHHLRDARETLPDELVAHVTGPAALSVDAAETFEAIDLTLLAATITLVLVLLLLIYRSPLVAMVPVLTVALSYLVAAGLSWLLVQALDLSINMQTTAILIVLMFGAGTDYCLLIVARYREELRRHADVHDAMRETVRHTTPAILCSGGTVIAAMLVLLLADSDPMRAMGPVLALGIAVTMVAGLTLLPAILTTLGRRSFWPLIPAYDPAAAAERLDEEPSGRGIWGRVAQVVATRPRTALVVPVALLVLFAAGSTASNLPLLGWGSTDTFRVTTDSAEGFDLLGESFPAGELGPTTVLVTGEDDSAAARAAAQAASLLAEREDVSRAIAQPLEAGSHVVQVVLSGDPFAEETSESVPEIREQLADVRTEHDVETFVGGPTAQAWDVNLAGERDERVIAPIALVVILAMLVVLLRSLIAPLHIMASVVLSYLATIGLSLWLFQHVFDQPGAGAGFALYVFIFVVALGVDYNIFLVTRIREETARLGSTRAGTAAGLQFTGGIITSAGLILAGTFAVLAVLPSLVLFQMGFAIALGVLIDTFLVRTLIVPASMHLLGERNWWPGRTPGNQPPPAPPASSQQSSLDRKPVGTR